MSLLDDLARCDSEITECLALTNACAMWWIGLHDWRQERRLIMEQVALEMAKAEMEHFVQDALRTEPTEAQYRVAIERLSNMEMIRLLHVAMGLATEAGEFVDQLKKHIFYGKPIDRVNLSEELGDTTWYERIGVDVLKDRYHAMLVRNVDKLKKRFPEKFSEEKATNRDLPAERSILEK